MIDGASTRWPQTEDLAPHARRNLERAYEARERRQMGREDFATGYLAALVDLGSKSSFRPGRWMPEGEVPW